MDSPPNQHALDWIPTTSAAVCTLRQDQRRFRHGDNARGAAAHRRLRDQDELPELVPGIHAAVRQLVVGTGHGYGEMEHTRERSICCGSGGMVPAVNPELARQMT